MVDDELDGGTGDEEIEVFEDADVEKLFREVLQQATLIENLCRVVEELKRIRKDFHAQLNNQNPAKGDQNG